MKASKLWVAIFYLGYEPLLNGNTSDAAKRSLTARLMVILELLKEYDLVVLGRKLNGRDQPELLTLLDVSSFVALAAPFTSILRYKQIKELLTSLEEDRVKIGNGNLSLKPSYRQKSKAMKGYIEDIREAFGLSKPKGRRSNVQVDASDE